ncbi:hypothetical protein [Kaistia sp. MMO-174]|uniref:hypothetical protein n=1 Tax=Kaistia sp. MMO-174 TaxID=3081256 RepID=UPI0030192864
MSVNYEKILAKLDRPPSGPNWARFVHPDVNKTAKSILHFVKGVPPVTYRTGYTVIRDRIQFGIDLETAINSIRRSSAPKSRLPNEEFVKAFFEHDERRRYHGHRSIEFDKESFRISRDIVVPVAPLSVIHENGSFVPLFICGWSSLNLSLFQRRLLVTITEDAFLSLTDFQHSPAEFLFFPKPSSKLKQSRVSEIWHRGDYELLSNNEINEAVDNFLEARALARQVILDEKENAPRNQTESGADRSEDFGDLFGGLELP